MSGPQAFSLVTSGNTPERKDDINARRSSTASHSPSPEGLSHVFTVLCETIDLLSHRDEFAMLEAQDLDLLNAQDLFQPQNEANISHTVTLSNASERTDAISTWPSSTAPSGPPSKTPTCRLTALAEVVQLLGAHGEAISQTGLLPSDVWQRIHPRDLTAIGFLADHSRSLGTQLAQKRQGALDAKELLSIQSAYERLTEKRKVGRMLTDDVIEAVSLLKRLLQHTKSEEQATWRDDFDDGWLSMEELYLELEELWLKFPGNLLTRRGEGWLSKGQLRVLDCIHASADDSVTNGRVLSDEGEDSLLEAMEQLLLDARHIE